MMTGLLVGVVAGQQSVLTHACVNISYVFAVIVPMLIVCDKTYRFGLPVLFAYGVTRSLIFFAFFVGLLGNEVFITGMEGHAGLNVLYAVAIVVLVVVSYIWLGPSRLRDEGSGAEVPKNLVNDSVELAFDNAAGADDGVDDNPSPSTAVDLLRVLIDGRVSELADEYHLTPREREVLTLLAWGKGARRIEEELLLSSNTVKTHMRHVYAKLGVHSRSELDKLLRIDRG